MITFKKDDNYFGIFLSLLCLKITIDYYYNHDPIPHIDNQHYSNEVFCAPSPNTKITVKHDFTNERKKLSFQYQKFNNYSNKGKKMSYNIYDNKMPEESVYEKQPRMYGNRGNLLFWNYEPQSRILDKFYRSIAGESYKRMIKVANNCLADTKLEYEKVMLGKLACSLNKKIIYKSKQLGISPDANLIKIKRYNPVLLQSKIFRAEMCICHLDNKLKKISFSHAFWNAFGVYRKLPQNEKRPIVQKISRNNARNNNRYNKKISSAPSAPRVPAYNSELSTNNNTRINSSKETKVSRKTKTTNNNYVNIHIEKINCKIC